MPRTGSSATGVARDLSHAVLIRDGQSRIDALLSEPRRALLATRSCCMPVLAERTGAAARWSGVGLFTLVRERSVRGIKRPWPRRSRPCSSMTLTAVPPKEPSVSGWTAPGEPPRVSWRLLLLGSWGSWYQGISTPPNCGNVRWRWSSSCVRNRVAHAALSHGSASGWA
jgi:hypothetical protein